MQNLQFKAGYTDSDRGQYLSRLRGPAMIGFISALATSVICFYLIFQSFTIEHLILGVVNISIAVNCVVSLYWSFQHSTDNVTLQYVHSVLSQINLAFEYGATISLIAFGVYSRFWPLLPIQLLVMTCLLYLIFVAHVFSHRQQFGVQRLILYVAIILTVILLAIAALYLKQLVNLLNLQIIAIDTRIIYFVEAGLVGLAGITIAFGALNWRRIRLYFITATFILMTGLLVVAMINGQLTREAQTLQSENNSTECRNSMQSIAESSLKQFCNSKYVDEHNSPYLTCPQNEQTYKWENNSNSLACINTQCCQSLMAYLQTPIKYVTILQNIILGLGIVMAFNAIVLTDRTYQSNKINIGGDILMLFIILCVVIMMVVIFKITPPPEITVQNVFAKQAQMLNEVKVLANPNYSHFTEQDKMIGFYNLQNCELATQLILEPIQSGIDRLAIQGINGKFLLMGDLKNVDILTTEETVKQVFPTPITDGQHDEVIVNSTSAGIKSFLQNNLYFCSETPLSTSFIIVQQSPPSRLLVADPLEKLTFYRITTQIQDIETFESITEANTFIYQGGFSLTSCQVITQLKPHFLQAQTDENGNAIFNNLAFGQQYTVLVKRKGYKNGCAQIDLAQQRKVQKLKYTIRLVKHVEEHSLSVILEWSSKSVNLDLYGRFTQDKWMCLTGPLSKDCAGMKHTQIDQADQHSEILTVTSLEPFKYLFFVKRFLSRSDALAKLQLGDYNQDLVESDPTVTVYVKEINYPIIQYRLPLLTADEVQLIDITWLVFEVDGSISDGPLTQQSYWSAISNEDISNGQAVNKKFWP